MTFAVIFSDATMCGPYGSVQEIRDLPCFPQPFDINDPDAWELIGEQVTKYICETNLERTGEIARAVS